MPERSAPLWRRCFIAVAAPACVPLVAHAQANYEIQVYGAETVAPGTLMVELHSNFTVDGQKYLMDGVYPTNHQEHETIELTEGLNDWSEVGFYIFTSEQDGHGVQWVGDHIRPRVRVPDSWGWPVGLSLSTEIGFQRSAYSTDTWSGRCMDLTSIKDWDLPLVRKSATTLRESSALGSNVCRLRRHR